MARTKLRRSPLQVPANSAEFLRTFVYDRAPTTADYKNFKITDLWIHRDPSGTPSYGYFILVANPGGIGGWLNVGSTTVGDVQSLSDDGETLLNPDINGDVEILETTETHLETLEKK